MSVPLRRVKDCLDPWTSGVINADGTVTPCCHAMERMGDLGEETFEEIWDGARFRTFRTFLASTTPLPACESCFVRGWKSEPAPRPSSGASGWRRVLAAFGGAAPRPPVPGAVSDLAIRTDREEYRRGETLSFVLSFSASALPPSDRLDVYLRVELPDGGGVFVTFDGRFVVIRDGPVPLLRAIEPLDVERLEIRGVPPGEPQLGEWRLVVTVTRAGRGLEDEAGRLATATHAFRLSA